MSTPGQFVCCGYTQLFMRGLDNTCIKCGTVYKSHRGRTKHEGDKIRGVQDDDSQGARNKRGGDL